ncbi:MAG: hypothetical protein WAT09_15040 [Paracoccaceae bacterium]
MTGVFMNCQRLRIGRPLARIALVLLILLVRLASGRDRRVLCVLLLEGTCTTLVTIDGLRRSFDIQFLRHVRQSVACVLPRLA